jgi:ribosomal protein L28
MKGLKKKALLLREHGEAMRVFYFLSLPYILPSFILTRQKDHCLTKPISMKLRIIAPLFAICLFCFSFTSIPPTRPGKGAISTVVDLSGEYNPMCGETIQVTGSMHMVQLMVSNKNKSRMMFLANYQGVSGYGTESGQRYNITFSNKNVQTVDLSGGRQSVTMSFNESLIAPGKGVLNFAVKAYMTFESDGSISAQDFEIVFCE